MARGLLGEGVSPQVCRVRGVGVEVGLLADGRASTQAAATEPWPGQLLTLGCPGGPMNQEVAAERCP